MPKTDPIEQTESLGDQNPESVSSYTDQPSEVSALPVNKQPINEAQKSDPTLQKCLAGDVSNDKKDNRVTYFFNKDLLMHKWTPSDECSVWNEITDCCSCCLLSTGIIFTHKSKTLILLIYKMQNELPEENVHQINIWYKFSTTTLQNQLQTSINSYTCTLCTLP